MSDESTARLPAPQLVYGSCVARDLVEIALGGPDVVSGYVARQSLISAFSGRPSTLVVPQGAPMSPFQRRMVEGDLHRGLEQEVRRAAGRGVRDVLWDLVDERLGVYVLEDGSPVTRSIDLMASGLDAQLADNAALLPLGSPEHLRRWTSALERFRSLTTEVGMIVTLLSIPWAECDDHGGATPVSFGISARTANAAFRPYIEAATSLFRTASLDTTAVTAARHHRWGPAPFHYTTDTYHRAAREVVRARGGVAAPSYPD